MTKSLSSTPLAARSHPDDMDDVIAQPLSGLVDFGAHTGWLTQSHLEGVDDNRLVEQWFAANFPIVTELYPAGVKVSAYLLHHRYDELPPLNPRAAYPDAELVPGITLAACELTTESVNARDETYHPPSGWAHIRLWWQLDEAVDVDYETTAQMVGPEGVWGERLYRENEVLDYWPTSAWQPGEFVREELDINLNPLTPPGVYPVVVGLRDPETGAVSPTVTCGDVEIR